MRTISFKVPDSLDQELTAAAKDRQVSKSALAREALEHFLTNGRKRRKRSAHDLMKRWIGPPSGLGDLSYNEKYMKGFGK